MNVSRNGVPPMVVGPYQCWQSASWYHHGDLHHLTALRAVLRLTLGTKLPGERWHQSAGGTQIPVEHTCSFSTK